METETYTPTRREQIADALGAFFVLGVVFAVLSFGGAL